ncbi:MAG: bifunctional DNA primase/polymerase [Nitriliruptorales bacterium]
MQLSPGVVTTHLDDALYYARELGWPVFPVAPRGKLPLIAKRDGGKGLHDATTNEETIRAWWARCPAANIGLRTGVTFDVVDIDGPKGLDALNTVRADRPMTWGPEAVTGGGGWHLLHSPAGAGNRAGIVSHVDYRGDGGYIVAPPSVHPSGERYFWAPGAGPDEPLEPLPDWLAEFVFPRREVEPARALSIPSQRLGAYAARAP